MGLIKAIAGSASGVMADQWKEFFYCESMPKDVLVTKGVHRTGKRSSNTKGTDNVITNGSVLAVADGQCMLIVEQGKVVDICAEPGEYIFDSMTAPSIFTGGLGAGILDTFRDIGKRFTFGGDKPSDQRIYYINTKEILENKFGTPNPIPFRVVDKNIGLDVDVSVRCSGVYSYKIVNPILFYTNVCGNVQGDYTRGEIDSQLKTEFISALQPAFAKISDMQVRPSALPAHAEELSEAMNTALTAKWAQLRGIQVISIAMNPITLPPEDAEMIKQAQRTAVMRDPSMAAATLVGAQADAMKAAAENEAGAFTGFLGMGMAQQAGNAGNVNGLFQMGQQQQAQQYAQQQAQMQQPQQPTQTPQQSAGEDSWVCSCGTTNTSKFCTNCGNKKPENDGSWICSCGAKNFGKFCTECGSKKPEEKKTFRCDKCGWTPEDPASHPKFCPECGDIFDDNDIVK